MAPTLPAGSSAGADGELRGPLAEEQVVHVLRAARVEEARRRLALPAARRRREPRREPPGAAGRAPKDKLPSFKGAHPYMKRPPVMEPLHTY